MSYMKHIWDEDLLEHRTANKFAQDITGKAIPTLVEMQVSQRRQKTYSDNFSAYFNFDFNIGNLKNKMVAGYDLSAFEVSRNGGWNRARGYRLTNGKVANKFNPANAANYLTDANGNPVPNVPHFDLQNPKYYVANLNDYVFQRLEITPLHFMTNGAYLMNQMSYGKFIVNFGIRQEWYLDKTNYKLKKPEYNEYADIMDINHNMDILDEEVNKKLDKTKKAADSEKLDGLDSLMFARSYSLHANDSIPKDVLNNPAYPQSYMGSINYGTEIGFTQGYIKIIYIPHASDGYGTQIAIPYDGGITYGMYYRNAVGNTWGEWIEQLDTRKRYPSDPTTIAVDNDANKCLATGKAYYCKHNATQNLPFGTVDDGILIPYIHFNNPIYGFQIFMTWNHQSIWWRRAINNNWDRYK